MKTHIAEYLEARGAAWRAEHHPHRVTAQEVAAVEHVSGKRFAKTIVLEVEDAFALAVLPADRDVDVGRLRAELGCDVRLADEARFATLFKDCDVGAMPPLGELYGMEVLADGSIATQPTIVFNAGSHDETIEMPWSTFARLAPVRILDFAVFHGKRTERAA